MPLLNPTSQETLMDNELSLDKVMLEHKHLDAIVRPNQEHIWKNILKIEALKKEDNLRKTQILCKNLQIK